MALTLFAQPLWGAALGVLLLGESLGAGSLAGAVLVLASLGLTLHAPTGPGPGGDRAGD